MTMTCGLSRSSSAAGDNGSVRARLVSSLILGIIALPVIFVGLIDPLEGGIALVLAVGLGFAVRLLSGVPLPRLVVGAMLATIAVGALALVLAIAGMPAETVQDPAPEATAPHPLNGGVRILVWAYRLGVLVVLMGGIAYLARIARALRGLSQAQSEELPT